MLATGLLFDIKVAAIAFSVPLLAALVLAARPAAHALWLRCLPGLGAVLATLFAASTVVSVYYFATFSRSIDIFVFGLMDDDTRAILATLWHGYPVLRTLALLAAVLGATYWLARRWGSGIMRARLARRAGSQRAAAVPDHRRHGAGLSRLAGHLSAQQGRHRHLVAAPAQRHHAQRHFGVLLGVVRARQRQALQPRHR